MVEDFLDYGRLVDDGDDSHLVLAMGANEGIGVPDFEDDIAPFFGGQFLRRRRGAGWPQGIGRDAAGFSEVALAPHLVGIPAVVADHLSASIGDVLGDGGQEIGGGKYLEVAMDFRVKAGAVDDFVGGKLDVHFLH